MTVIMRPAELNAPDVIEFLELWGLSDPVILNFTQIDPLYKPDNCHILAKHRVNHHGGIRIHGWALWQYKEVVVGNFHSVWLDQNAKLIDVTPPKNGYSSILFVQDASLEIKNDGILQRLYNNRTSYDRAPFIDWETGEAIPDEYMYIQNDNPVLVSYCQKLGLPDTDMR